MIPINQIILGDALEVLRGWPDGFVNCCVTSPPYWGLRDYGVNGQLGLEPTPEEFVAKMVDVFREVRRVLADDGTLWLNIGDSYCNSNCFARASAEYQRDGRNNMPANDRKLDKLHAAGFKTKDLIGIPWMLAFALRADGWWLRQDIIWAKKNCMPESVTDRCTKSHEYIFLLSKSQRYFYDADAISEAGSGRIPGNKVPQRIDATHGAESIRILKAQQEPQINRNRRSVWTVATQAFPGSHFATFPPKLIEPCILAGCPMGGVVLDPFMGAGTTAVVAVNLGRNYVGVELNPDYLKMAQDRIKRECAQLNMFHGMAK